VEGKSTFCYEVHLCHFRTRPVEFLNPGIALKPPCVEVHDAFVNEALFAHIEERLELSTEVREQGLDQFSLVAWWQEVVEVSLLDDKVEIMFESFLCAGRNALVKFRFERLSPGICKPHAPHI